MSSISRRLAALVAVSFLLGEVAILAPTAWAATAADAPPTDVPLPPIDPGQSPIAPPDAPVFKPHTVRLPEPVALVATTGVDKAAQVDGLPVTLRTTAMAVASGDKSPVPIDVAVDSLDRDTAETLGADVFAFGISLAKPIDVNALIEVTIDYSGFRYILGADWAQRLQVGRWSCGAETARSNPKACGDPVIVAHVANDLERGR